MPNPLDSLAVLPIATGLTFLLRSVGVAFSEVVIAHLDTVGSSRPLRRSALGLAAAVTLGFLLIAVTPLSSLWFGEVTGLSENLARLARSGLFFALLLPGVSTVQSWMRGIVLHSRETRSVTESTLIYFALSAGVLWTGIVWGKHGGAFVGLAAMTVGDLAAAGWLVWRSRHARKSLQARDSA